MRTSFPKKSIRVLLLEGVHAVAAQMLSDEGFTVETHEKALDGAALRRALAGDTPDRAIHALGLRSKTRLDAAALAAAPRLLTAACFCIGTDQVDLTEARRRGVAVFNTPFSNTRSVAELTLAELIALARRLTDQSARLHKGDWNKSAEGAHEVRGQTLGIVGYGHIGSQLSVLAEAFGMRVLFFDIIPKLPLGNARACRSLDELLKSSDFVSLHVPATPVTQGPPPLIGKSQLKAMKRGSFLINNARGGVVDVAALAAALREGHLAGAALDVFPQEPSGKGERFASDLQGLPNVILTPHIGGSTEEAQQAIAADAAGKIIRLINNGSTTSSVNLPEVDLPEQGAQPDRRAHRLLHLHHNVPGVLSKVNAACAAAGANILAQHLQTRGDVGYVVLDVQAESPAKTRAIAEQLRALPETIRVRPLW